MLGKLQIGVCGGGDSRYTHCCVGSNRGKHPDTVSKQPKIFIPGGWDHSQVSVQEPRCSLAYPEPRLFNVRNHILASHSATVVGVTEASTFNRS